MMMQFGRIQKKFDSFGEANDEPREISKEESSGIARLTNPMNIDKIRAWVCTVDNSANARLQRCIFVVHCER